MAQTGRLVQVAVDAPGVRGGQTFSYRVPARLDLVGIGDAVVVEYGRQAAVGVVIGDGTSSDGAAADRAATTGQDGAAAGQDGLGLVGDIENVRAGAVKPIRDRVGDDPVLPPLTAHLVDWVARHYLAPPGMVVRQALAPGALEGIELVAVPPDRPADLAFGAPDAVMQGSRDAVTLNRLDRELVAAILHAPEGSSRAALAELPGQERDLDRRLSTLADAGLVGLRWRFPEIRTRARGERTVLLTDAGREAADVLEAGERLEGRQLGPRQAALLLELASVDTDEALAAAPLAERHGGSAVLGLARRAFLELSSRARAVERAGLGRHSEDHAGAAPPVASAESVASAALGAATGRLVAAVCSRASTPFLLTGPAGDRRAVYAATIAAAIELGRPVLVLVPEIALARPMLDRLPACTSVAVVHSAMSDGERADAWQRVRSGNVQAVVGTRLAVLAPLADIGLVIVDDEHDAAYKSERTPRYQARDVALEAGRLAGAPVILGSATPDLVSVGRARRGELTAVVTSDRSSLARPNVEIVDLRDELSAGNRGLLSTPLVDAISALDREAGQQAILVLNRRGSASVVLCRDCGYVQVCPECERPLVFHAAQMALRCHHCGATAPVARRCPACASVRIRYLGGGTQRVEHDLHVQFPDLRIARLDRDVVERRGEAERIIDRFVDREIDVLVGTGLVTKGSEIGPAALVGVISADVALSLPDERAAERTWQLLEAAVARADPGGRAIIQTYRPDHPVLTAVATTDADAFVEDELERRRRFGSPPFGSLIKLTVALEDRATAERTARAMAEELRERARSTAVAVLGPVPAYVARRAGRWRFHVVLRGDDPRSVLGEDPGSPWSIDVDPESLL